MLNRKLSLVIGIALVLGAAGCQRETTTSSSTPPPPSSSTAQSTAPMTPPSSSSSQPSPSTPSSSDTSSSSATPATPPSSSESKSSSSATSPSGAEPKKDEQKKDERRWPWRVTPWFQAMLRYAPDIIEVEDPGLVGWVALHAARELGVPLVAFCHSELVGTVARRLGPIPATVMRAYLRSFYRRCDLVLTPSEFMRRPLLRWGVDNVVVRPLGVDLKIFNPAARTMTLRRELGLAESARILVYAGRFACEKNLSVLLAAFRRLGRPYYLLM